AKQFTHLSLLVLVGALALTWGATAQAGEEDNAHQRPLFQLDQIKLALKTACLLAPVLLPIAVLVGCLGSCLSVTLCIIIYVVTLLVVVVLVAIGLFLLYSGPMAGNPENPTELVVKAFANMADAFAEAGVGAGLNDLVQNLGQTFQKHYNN